MEPLLSYVRKHRRHRLSRGWLAGVLLAGVSSGAVSAPEPTLPPDTLLLMVAPWCAPCWGEIARIDALAAGAAPLRVRVVAMEDGRRAAAMVADLPPERRWTAPPAARAALWARTPGLPHSVATDAAGRVCAERGGGLDPARARALAVACGVRR